MSETLRDELRDAAARRPAEAVLRAITTTHWAITEGALEQIVAIAERTNLTPEAIEAERGQRLENTRDVTVRDGVATIQVVGPLIRFGDFFTRISGATSYETLARDIGAALRSPEVGALLLDIDSPGGEVHGVSELAALVYGARGTKPITAFISGTGASAAYWLASAADEVIATDTAVVGSIGAVVSFADTRRRDRAQGVRRMRVVSSQSPRKNLDPISGEGRAAIQATVDSLAEVFIEAVARHRGVTAETVLERFGQGAVFVGDDAVERGLVDGISTYEAAHAALVARLAPAAAGEPRRAALASTPPRRAANAARAGLAAAAAAPTLNPEPSMARDTTAGAGTPAAGATDTANPASSTPAEPAPPTGDSSTAAASPAAEAPTTTAGTVAGTATLADSAEAATELAQRFPLAVASLRTAAATAERERILGIERVAMPGHAQLVADCKADAGCSPEQAALRLVQAENAARGGALQQLRGDESAISHARPLAPDAAAAHAGTAGEDATVARILGTHAQLNPDRAPATTGGTRRPA